MFWIMLLEKSSKRCAPTIVCALKLDTGDLKLFVKVFKLTWSGLYNHLTLPAIAMGSN